MERLPDVSSLQLLVQVAKRGSIGAAAHDAGVSQPAVSKRITALERELGVRLLDRSRRGSALTDAGELVTGWAGRVLDELTVLTDGVEALRREAAGQLTVAASLTVAEHLLPGWLGKLRRSLPELHVGLQVMNSMRVCELTRDQLVDVGFIESPTMIKGLRSRVVARDRLVLVVSRRHPWARRRRPVDVTELAATPVISRERGSGTRETLEHAASRAGSRLVAPLLELGSSAAIRSTVLDAGGPAVLSELIVAADLAAGVLVEVPTDGIDLTRVLRAVWPSTATPPAPAEALIRCALRSSSGRR
ncbi:MULTISPECIES: LysR family transcriptional regulator [Pseudonocardia]|uniref:HTH-type transcriptional regulator CysL n=2 Tax=Pseudonocardia TaxID=1847 RepID=A0A1Y2MKN0_PSEAH|nr:MULTISPECIES: LysR family transcriptional regulator [Pseudonocardia]OSY35601.1 HTH-type transcriptional regulator CysL [Pseudonocardia autotrophica]TDN76892.1 molybdate transport repressor ModE-like protein [Pseudonocardia autotrophica]BBG00895.1 LysR family transcriptional regulator [Pseudonocardia autotrophica]GEC27546.1 LysR family transcriptional regulator [Pseudonocardia saturnea]